MNRGEQRRQTILETLTRGEYITGHDLASQLHVSRQIIVQDIAILRAEGVPITATPRGYWYQQSSVQRLQTIVAVQHSPDPIRVREELVILVSAGVIVVNVIVAHPLYGELVGNLDIRTLAMVDTFIAMLKEHRTSLLSALTDGVHLHTISGDPYSFLEAKQELRRARLLLGDSRASAF